MAPSDPSALYRFDRDINRAHNVTIIGLDEAGRGPLAGPVVAGAVILDPDRPLPGIDDSKKLTARKRDALHTLITANAPAWAVGICTHDEIDRINILAASLLAMERALEQIRVPWTLALIDGNQPLPNHPVSRQQTVVKGDTLSASIAAASIIAKVTRDRIMDGFHVRYPLYGFDRHKGYPTAQHRDLVAAHGMSPIHRRTFCQRIATQVTLDL